MMAVVLGRRDFQEYDQLISFYSRSHGKLELLAKGVKKIISKNAAHLEPCCIVDIGIAPGAEIDRLTSVQCVSHFSAVRSHEQKLQLTLLVLHTIDRIVKPNEPDYRIFDLVENWLHRLGESSSVHPGTVDLLFLELLVYLGFDPQEHISDDISNWTYGKLHHFTLTFMQNQLEMGIPDWAQKSKKMAL